MNASEDSSPAHVLDASALLALLQGEPGADAVEETLGTAAMSTVNLAEVLHKTAQYRIPDEGLEYDLEALGVRLVPFDDVDARRTSEVWERAPRAGLSLGDRACLALAERLDAEALTADRSWSRLREFRVRVIR